MHDTLQARLAHSEWQAGTICFGMFAFFSNRLGCLGSIVVSAIGTVILLALLRGCHG